MFIVHQALLNSGIPTDVADSFGFTGRIIATDDLYRHGQHKGVTETDVLKAVNGFVDKVQAPAWAHATPQEVRRLRMRLLVLYPLLMASTKAPDSTGHYRAVDDTMSPLEAIHLATSLLYQKQFNEDFQLSDAERTLDLAVKHRLHAERTNAIKSITDGTSNVTSMRDVLGYSDQMLLDLGIDPTPSSSSNTHNSPSTVALLTNGGR